MAWVGWLMAIAMMLGWGWLWLNVALDDFLLKLIVVVALGAAWAGIVAVVAGIVGAVVGVGGAVVRGPRR